MLDPQTLFIRTDVLDSEYQQVVRDLFLEKDKKMGLRRKNVYWPKDDEKKSWERIESLAKKLGVSEEWKVFDFESEACRSFRRDSGGRYTSIELAYDEK